jgi:hypothetical protein
MRHEGSGSFFFGSFLFLEEIFFLAILQSLGSLGLRSLGSRHVQGWGFFIDVFFLQQVQHFLGVFHQKNCGLDLGLLIRWVGYRISLLVERTRVDKWVGVLD